MSDKYEMMFMEKRKPPFSLLLNKFKNKIKKDRNQPNLYRDITNAILNDKDQLMCALRDPRHPYYVICGYHLYYELLKKGLNYYDVPNFVMNTRTVEMYIYALSMKKLSLDQELINVNNKINIEEKTTIYHVPLKTYDEYLNLIKYHGCLLYHVPYEYFTFDIIISAVIENGMSLRFVPKIRRTYDICCLAVKQNKNAIQYVPKYFRDIILRIDL